MSADHVARSAFIEGKPSPVGAVASAVVPAGDYRYGSVRGAPVFRQVGDFRFAFDGRLAVLRGGNGTGKSTLLRWLYQNVGPAVYLPEELGFPPDLRPREILELFAPGSDSSRPWAGELSGIRSPFGQLSKGTKQKVRVQVALGLAARFRGRVLLLLDEPTSGIDQVAQGEFWREIDAFARTHAERAKVLVVTHETSHPSLAALAWDRVEHWELAITGWSLREGGAS